MLLTLLSIAPSSAQPLEDFLAASQEHALDRQVSGVDVRTAEVQRGRAMAGVLPALKATAGYTRNQVAVEAVFPDASGNSQTVTISALDQLEASARVDLPLIDLPAWTRWAAAGKSLEAARRRAAEVDGEVTLQVTQAWFDWGATQAVHRAATVALQTAQDQERVIDARLAAGLANPLDQSRARADTASADETLAQAQLDVAVATRRLVELTGLTPQGEPTVPDTSASEEAPLDTWLQRLPNSDSLRAAQASTRSAHADRFAASSALLPSVAGFASERWTNAAGFGPNALWSAGVVATWRFDALAPADVQANNQALARARLNEEGVRQRLITDLTNTWHQVESLRRRVIAAPAAEQASRQGAEVARARLLAGTGSQLDVSLASRALFEAEVNRVRALASLQVERRRLRLTVGLPPDPTVQP